MNEWKTIDSAPKDGTLVLLCGNGYIKTGYFDKTPQMGPYPNWKWGVAVNPTHWMELPKPPTKPK